MTSDNSDQRDPQTPRAPVNILPLLDDTELFKQAGGLLTTDQFIKVCKERGLKVFEEELEYYERRGLLYPLLRIQRPAQWYDSQGMPIERGEGEMPLPGMFRRYQSYGTTGENLLTLQEEGLLTQPDAGTFQPWAEYRDAEAHYQEKVDTYYALYQILHIHWLKRHLTLEERYHRGATDGDAPIPYMRVLSDRLPSGEYLKSEVQKLDELVAFLLVIQNRYRPAASGILSGYHNRQDYQRYKEVFSSETAWTRFPIPLEELRTTRWLLCHQAREMDPLEGWHDLVGYVSASKRWTLKGAALLAQEFYTIIEMISQFLRDLAEQRGQTEEEYSCLGSEHYEQQMFGRRLNFWVYDILEHILTDYDLNPRPKALFVVEGDTEAAAIPILCEAMKTRLSTFGIELHSVEGAGKDLNVLLRYAVPPRLGVAIEPGIYAAVRQTRVFALFDREHKWQHDTNVERFLAAWRTTVNSLLPPDLPIEAKEQIAMQGVMVERWQRCFEFDNFTDDELAEAISGYAASWGWPQVDAADVARYRARFPNPPLSNIVAEKVRAMRAAGQDTPTHKDFKLNKIEVGKLLAYRLAEKIALHKDGDPPEAPIVDIIIRVVNLALSSWP